jgi:hypothetical protein
VGYISTDQTTSTTTLSLKESFRGQLEFSSLSKSKHKIKKRDHCPITNIITQGGERTVKYIVPIQKWWKIRHNLDQANDQHRSRNAFISFIVIRLFLGQSLDKHVFIKESPSFI